MISKINDSWLTGGVDPWVKQIWPQWKILLHFLQIHNVKDVRLPNLYSSNTHLTTVPKNSSLFAQYYWTNSIYCWPQGDAESSQKTQYVDFEKDFQSFIFKLKWWKVTKYIYLSTNMDMSYFYFTWIFSFHAPFYSYPTEI